MARTRVKLNSAGMKEILNSADVANALEAPAQEILARMKGSAPTASGALQSSLEVWDETTDRVVKRIGSRAVPYASTVEAETGFMARSL